MSARKRVLLPLLSLLTSCGYGSSRLAHEAQTSMVGMSQSDLYACAGPPTKVMHINPQTEVDTYGYTPSATSGVSLTLPLTLGALTVGGSSTSCTAMMRIVDNRVTEVHYTGATNETIGTDGGCAPVVRGCVLNPEPSMRAAGPAAHDKASAFAPPPVPPQPAASQPIVSAPPATPAGH